MDIRCECSACQAQFRIDAKYAGRKGKCPKCGAAMVVPEMDAGTSPPKSAPKPAAKLAAKPAPPSAAHRPTPAPPSAAHRPTPSTPSAPPKRTASVPTGAASAFEGIGTKPSPGRSIDTGNAGGVTQQRVARRGKKADSSQMLLVGALLGGAALVLVASLAGMLIFTGGGGALAATNPLLVIHWPEADRTGAKILINGVEKNLPSNGEVRFELKPGQYDLLLLRRGYEQFEADFTLKKGQKPREITPTWEPNRIAMLRTNSTDAAVGGNDDEESSFAGVGIGSESLETLPAGFGKGWTQNFQKAQEEAVKKDKKLLLLFTGSDWCPPCRQLEESVLHNDEFTNYVDARFAKVVLDFPRGQEANGRVLDIAQNVNLQGKYGVRGFPTVVLAMADGKPYAFLVGTAGGSADSYVAKLQELENMPREMKELFAEVDAVQGDARLDAAIKAVEWLQKHNLLRFYGSKVRKFVALAKELDGKNKQGKYEILFEADWKSRLHDAREDWSVAEKIVAELEQWKDGLKFQDVDRGARLHLAAAVAYAVRQDKDGVAKHVEAGLAYAPTDSDTLNKLKRLESFFSGLAGTGTGWIAALDGYIMTNNHVVAGARKVTVYLPGTETEVAAKIIATDAKRDMALLKIDVPGGTPWTPRPVRAMPKHGADVAVLGFPLGESGLKISKGGVMGMPLPSNGNMIETDCTVNPGNSGGPLCDTRGNVVGMVTAKSLSNATVDSHGLALPGKDLLKFMSEHIPNYAPLPPDEAEEKLDGAKIIELAGPTVMMIRNKQ